MGVEFGLYTHELLAKKLAPDPADKSASKYHQSIDLVAQAEAAQRAGDIAKAQGLWRQAATLQRDWVCTVDDAKQITKSVFAESAAVLFERAGDHSEAAKARALKPPDTISNPRS